METIKDIFNSNTIEYYKKHKEEITSELLSTLRKSGNEGKQLALDILDTEKKGGYYLDSYGNKISFLGDRELKKPFTQMNLSKIHIEEIKKCSQSLDYFRENYVKIRTKKGFNFPELRNYQSEFLKAIQSDYESIVSLQPRQSGKSVTVSIYLAWLFNFDSDKNIGICANKGGLAKEFLNNVKDIFYSLPMWMRVGVTVWNKSSIESENKMRILTDSPSADAFRGFSLSVLVVDETAFIKTSKYSEFIDSVTPTQSALAWKKNIFISTANGLNHFYELVEGAKKRKEYKFISYKEKNDISKKYKILDLKQNSDGTYNVTVDEPSNGMLFYGVDWKEVPRYDSKGVRKTNEQFKNEVIDKFGLVYFNQNYACQFLGSSYTLVDSEVLKGLKSSECEAVYDDKLSVYVEPEENHKYIMGVDPAKHGLDYYSVNIIDVTSFPFVQVATARILKANYQVMPEFIYEWGCRFNNAFVIVENNEGAGTYAVNILKSQYEYENLYISKNDVGFRTTVKTRIQILETFKNFLENKRLIIKDKTTISELFTFIIKDKKYQADDGCHDDMIMSLCLCFVPFIDVKNFDDNLIELIKKLYSNDDMSDESITDYLCIGEFDSIDDGYEDSLAGKKYDDEFEYSTDYYGMF